jgi:hypothetical protein
MPESDKPSAVPASLVMRLRQATDMPIMECRRHLEQLPPERWLQYVMAAEAYDEAVLLCGPGLLFRRQWNCPHCRRQTLQLRHGYDQDGGLWKGHVCACGSWQCTACGQLLDRRGPCCK